MKVLIVKVSALGDVVHALPVLAYLHEVVPGVEVDWLVERSFAPLLSEHPLLRQVIELDTRGWRREGGLASLRGSLAVVKRLRSEDYDVVLDLQGNSKSGLFTRLCGAGRRVGFDRDQVREWPNLMATNMKVSVPDSCHHITSRYLEVVKVAFPGDVEVPTAGPLPLDKEVTAKVDAQLREQNLDNRPFIVAHYGTTWETKLWPLEAWLSLVETLAVNQGRNLVLTWGNDAEREAALKMAAASQGRAVVWPRGTLPELVALLAKAQLVIGADTGPVHIAAAVKTPTVSMFRVTDSLRNGPVGPEHISLQAPLDCSPCLRKECERADECANSIPPEQVLDAVEQLIGHPGAGEGA